MSISQSEPFQILKALRLVELVFVAGQLSEGRKKWTYDKRSRLSVRRAIVTNVMEDALTQTLEKSLGEKMPSGDFFPKAIQSHKRVFGPLGFLRSIENRSRYEADGVANILTKYVQGRKLLEKVIREYKGKIPREVIVSAKEIKERFYEETLIQAVLTYLNDKDFCSFLNMLLSKQEIRIDITGLYEDIEYPWIVTRYGLLTIPEEEPVENLAHLIRGHYKEENLEPELRQYAGDFWTRLLEYCIIESPEVILRKLFGLPKLRQIAKELGFVSDKIGDSFEAVSIVLLGLGFGVPPNIAGISVYINSIEKYEKDLSESHDVEKKTGIMSQVFVTMERTLRDLSYFYIAFLWKNTLEDWESDIEEEMTELNSRQIKIKALDTFIERKFKIKKSFERLGFGDFLSLLRTVNNTARNSEKLKKKLSKSFEKISILDDEQFRILDGYSSYRSSFTHTKDYPGDEKCNEVVTQFRKLLGDFQVSRTYPLVMKISREVSDSYGKSYAECMDESGKNWLVYTNEYIEAPRPYFIHSKTPNIAVNPVVVEKIF
jgi:hypothetical protein